MRDERREMTDKEKKSCGRLVLVYFLMQPGSSGYEYKALNRLNQPRDR